MNPFGINDDELNAVLTDATTEELESLADLIEEILIERDTEGEDDDDGE